MKETKIEIPAGCEVEKIETQDGHVVVTFKEKERKLPKSWEEFCEMYPIKDGEYYAEDNCYIIKRQDVGEARFVNKDRNLLPEYAAADAVLALCQLIQLRNCYNGDWVPDWKDVGKTKFMIIIYEGEIDVDCANSLPSSLLYFKSKELRDEFLQNFRDLIEKLKPLYGIKEGGRE